MNSVNISGRLTKDPEIRKTTTGKSVCSFTLAVDKKMSKDQKTAAESAKATMDAGIKDEDYIALQSAVEAFRRVDANAFAKTITALENAIIVLKR